MLVLIDIAMAWFRSPGDGFVEIAALGGSPLTSQGARAAPTTNATILAPNQAGSGPPRPPLARNDRVDAGWPGKNYPVRPRGNRRRAPATRLGRGARLPPPPASRRLSRT